MLVLYAITFALGVMCSVVLFMLYLINGKLNFAIREFLRLEEMRWKERQEEKAKQATDDSKSGH